MHILMNLLILSTIIYLIALLFPAVQVKNFGTAIVVAIVYSVLNFFLGWFFTIISFPFMLLTLGLFKFVINAFFLWITDKMLPDFKIRNFMWTIFVAFLISLSSTIVNLLF